MEDKIKKPTVGEMLKQAVSDVNIKNQKEMENPFNEQSTIISAKQLDVDRYATFNSKTYGKLGFDPFKDNNKIYNQNTHWSEDIGRATTGMLKLAKIGFQDTFGFGIMAEKDNYKNFETVMKNYSSTRGGYTQFWANTQLSAGYTVGILSAIAAEEVGLALTTGGLGFVGSSGLVGTQLGNALKKMDKISRSSKYIDKIAELGHTDEAAKFFSYKGISQNLSKLGGKLNPVGETANFIRQTKLDEFSDLNSLQKLSIGAGALAKDARKIYMTHSESKLEAQMARDEFKENQIQKAKLASADGTLTNEDINRIDTDASNVYNSTYMGNLGLIYATNALTFDNMWKSMRYSNKMFSIPGKLTTTLGKDGLLVKAVKGFSVKGALKTGKKAVMDFSLKESSKDAVGYVVKNYKVAGAKLLEKGLSNSVEGIQELGQDVISNSVQSFYGRNHTGKQVRGGFLEKMYQAASDFSLKDVGEGIVNMATTIDKKTGERVINQEGLTTFGSGFFMGTIASPFGATIGGLQSQIVGGGIKSKVNYLINREEYIKNQKTKYKESLAKAKVLTQIFNDNLGSYLDHASNPVVTQTELQEEILDAAEKGDKKKFEDKKNDSFQQGVKTMLRNNSEGMFTDFLDDMATNYTPEQLNQAMGRTDITAENVASYKTKLQAKSASIKEFRKTYDRVNNEVINPIRQSDIDRLDASDPEQRKEKLDLMIYKKAWDNLKDELLFNHGKIANKAQRMIELEKQLKKETDLAPTEIQALISKESLSKEIKILQTQVEANKNLNLKGSDAKDAAVAEQKFEALKKYQSALSAIEKAESATKVNVDTIDTAYSDLFEAYHEFRTIDDEYGAFYGKMEPEEVKRAISRKSFDAIVDYLDLKAESQALQSVVNTLVDTKSASMWVERNAEMMANLDKNKERHIANQLKAFNKQASSSEMLTELQESGLFFDLNEIDDLVEDGIMPSQIYNIETNKPASKEEYKKAQDLISSFYKNLTGKTITQNKAVQSKTSLRYESDKRMVEDLMDQYGIELDKEMDLSDPAQLTKLIKKLKASKYLTYIDKEILDVVSDSTPKIKFTTSGEFPIEISEDGVITIDLRYAGHDYKNASVNFETLILSALTQAKLTDNLEKNEALKTEVDVLMNQAKDAFAKKYPNTDVEKISMLNNTAEFLSESLNNASFQKFLGGINDTVSGTKKSLWTSLMAKIMKAFGQTFDKSVLQRAVSLANITLDENIVDSIDEKNDTTETPEEDEEPDPVSSVEKNDYKLIEVVPGVWQVTGKGEVKAFDTKEEAEAYFNEKAVPPTKTVKQTVKEKVTRTVSLGNTDFIKNASEMPDVFGEFLHPEVVSNNKQQVDEWTQKIVALGAELDAAGVTDWNYGSVRVDVDDRLVIDVTAEVPEMGTKETTTNTPNAKVAKLKKELAEIKLKIINLSTSTGRYNELSETAAREEFQKELDVVNFSRNKFPGNKMPLYQYLRMLNATKPVVGQFAHFIERNKTSNPKVIKLGVVTSVKGNSFTYIDKSGKTQTKSTEDITQEFGNAYHLFSESEIKKELTYEEAIQVAQERFNKKVGKVRANAAPFRTDEKSLLEYWDKTVNGNVGVSPYSKEFLKDLRKKALNQLDKEAQENKKMFGKVQAPTKQDVEKRAQKLFLDVVESNRQYTNVFDWNVFDALGGMSSKFKSSDAADLLLVGDVRDNLESHDFKFYENFNEKGERYVSILVPISDPTNPTRSAKFAAISIGIPDTMTAAEIANPILEEAKKLSANSAVTTTAQMKDMAIPMAKKILRDKFEAEYNRTDTSSKELDELENKKKELEEQLSNEPESIEFTDSQNVQTGTKTVKFLMYKSTGTGSTADSKGEWVPLIAIGTHPDGKEWFVKAYHEGQDPKFNKYGSQTFAAIDQDLKNKEKELFKGKKSTQEIEEEVEREIDVEVPADTEETPEEANQRVLDEETELKNEINSRREVLKRINEQINSTSKMNLRKRIKLGNQKKDILLEIKSLQEKLDFTYGASSVISPAGSTETPGQAPVQNEPEYDFDNNVVITQNTPFESLPYKLQEDLLEQHRMDLGSTAVGAVRFKYQDLIKELESLNLAMSQTEGDDLDALDEKFGEVYDKLTSQVGPNININLNEQGKIEVSTVKKDTDATAEEIAAIESKMANDITYMRTIIEYNKSLESNEPDTTVVTTDVQDTPELTTEQELERAKRIKQDVIDKAKETIRARRAARQKTYVPVTVDERESVVDLLKKTFKDDFDILTKPELDYLVDSMLSDSKSFQFKIPDAIAFLNKKKLNLEARSQFEFINEHFSEELSKLRAQERADAVKVYQKDIFEEMVDNRFDYNYDIIKTGVKSKKIFSVTYNGKTAKFTLSPKEFRALAMYNNDIFKNADSKENLLIQIHTVLRNVKYYANNYKKNLKFEGTPQEIEDKLIEMYFMLGKKGLLLPAVVRSINYALYNANVNLTIIESNVLTGQAYTIEARASVAKRAQPVTKLAEAKEFIANYVNTEEAITSEYWQEALVAEWFFNPNNRINPEFINKNFSRGAGEKTAYKSFISDKSEYISLDGLSDAISQDYQDRMINADVNLQKAIKNIFDNYTTITDMVMGVAESLKNNKREEAIKSDKEYDEEEAAIKKMANSIMSEEENQMQQEYLNSLEFKIESGNLDIENMDYESFTEYQKFLFDRAVEDEVYPAPKKPTEKKPQEKPIDLFEEGLNEMAAKQTSIDKEEMAVRTEMRELTDSFAQQKALLAKISDISNDDNLKMFIAIYKIVNDEPALNVFNEQQRNILNDRLSKRLKQGAFIGQSVTLNDKIFQIVSYDVNNQTMEVADIKTGEIEIIPFTDFANIKDVHEVGQEITNLKLKTEIKDQEIEIIKDAYKDIFSNFTANVSEYETIEDDDLNSKIIEQLTKCK